MLILDKENCMTLKERVDEYSCYGVILYYLYETNSKLKKDFYNMFFESDKEKSCFSYKKILRCIKDEDIRNAKIKYSNDSLNSDALNLTYLKKLISKLYDDNKILNSKIYMDTYNYLLQ